RRGSAADRQGDADGRRRLRGERGDIDATGQDGATEGDARRGGDDRPGLERRPRGGPPLRPGQGRQADVRWPVDTSRPGGTAIEFYRRAGEGGRDDDRERGQEGRAEALSGDVAERGVSRLGGQGGSRLPADAARPADGGGRAGGVREGDEWAAMSG